MSANCTVAAYIRPGDCCGEFLECDDCDSAPRSVSYEEYQKMQLKGSLRGGK
ncbi:MAG: hypothetical protein MPEBLZ_04388 [Candidatus Methanoperedens nitroreducens]|uniref:Uncharacterized protein n=1 Tax=Candidatus Methanoperedens nitratireducens TaxID=1392998 RepID=A0A0N8KQ40_9EURY|nr:MAG: hypothetical protein MPEBLZ_04388 [Candidatus Methanoperedens sp. BLZ1]MBZ0175243.1 hypothetical protein [Candidatus Methanoperedens nitroreducens]MCX9076515.1 hypothetical protein [Candidatus Methanoperedens sp.]